MSKSLETIRRSRSFEFPMMAELVPEDRVGTARVEHFEVDERAARHHNAMSSLNPGGALYFIDPGKYARLYVGDELMMSDTTMERNTNRELARRANGRVLIAGLGLGMVLHAVAGKPEVTHITVVELHVDVLKLIVPTLPYQPGKQIRIVNEDVLTWKPPAGQIWDTIYFDIWPTITTDNLAAIKTLHQRFSHRLNRQNPNHWMSSWMVDWLRSERRSERRQGW